MAYCSAEDWGVLHGLSYRSTWTRIQLRGRWKRVRFYTTQKPSVQHRIPQRVLRSTRKQVRLSVSPDRKTFMKIQHEIRIRRIPEYALALTALRERRKIKQSSLAKKLGISPMGLSHFERGTRIPRLDQLEAWANALAYEVHIKILPAFHRG